MEMRRRRGARNVSLIPSGTNKQTDEQTRSGIQPVLLPALSYDRRDTGLSSYSRSVLLS